MKQIHAYTLVIGCLLISQLVVAQYTENDWADRDTWMNVNYIFDQAAIKEGSRVADIGCHEGYLSVRLAKRIGSQGKVYAVDVRDDRLLDLKNNLKDRSIDHVEVILGDYDNPKLPENSLDVVVIMDTYHEMYDYMKILGHVYASLKPGGRIVIVEKLKSRIKGKTREEQTDAHSLSAKYVKEELKEAGFEVTFQNDDLGNWENDSTKVIWMVIGTKL